MATSLKTAFQSERFKDLDISSDVKKTGKHYFSIGEHADVWQGDMKNKSGESLAVAIKVLRGGSASDPRFVDKLTTKLVERAVTWRQLDHKNVIRFYGIALNCGYMPALVLPFYSKGNIVNYIKREAVDVDKKLGLVTDIAQGIQYLHSLTPPVIHGDIRGANVLIDDGDHAVLADYGLVFVIETTDFTSTKTAGTCRWTAPEVMNPSEEILEEQEPVILFTMPSDIYAFAMTAFEIFSGDVPFSNKKNDSAVIFYVLGENRPESPKFLDSASPALQKLVERCWDSDASKRPTADSLVEELGQVAKSSAQETYGGWFGRLMNYFWPA